MFRQSQKLKAGKRQAALFLMLVLVGSLSFGAPAYAQTKKPVNYLSPYVLSSFTNQQRLAKHLKTLKVSPTLNKVAQMKAENMAKYGYFAHTSPRGTTPWYWFDVAGYDYEYAGENLAVNFKDAKSLTSAWMQSPSHKANIVDKHYTEIGTGVASGYLHGKKVIFVAQVYGNPA